MTEPENKTRPHKLQKAALLEFMAEIIASFPDKEKRVKTVRLAGMADELYSWNRLVSEHNSLISEYESLSDRRKHGPAGHGLAAKISRLQKRIKKHPLYSDDLEEPKPADHA